MTRNYGPPESIVPSQSCPSLQHLISSPSKKKYPLTFSYPFHRFFFSFPSHLPLPPILHGPSWVIPCPRLTHLPPSPGNTTLVSPPTVDIGSPSIPSSSARACLIAENCNTPVPAPNETALGDLFKSPVIPESSLLNRHARRIRLRQPGCSVALTCNRSSFQFYALLGATVA